MKKGFISLNQTQYVENMLQKYNMHESHPVTAPLDIYKGLLKK